MSTGREQVEIIIATLFRNGCLTGLADLADSALDPIFTNFLCFVITFRFNQNSNQNCNQN